MNVVLLAFFFLINCLSAEYLEVSITNGQPIYSDNNIINFDDLKVKKVNKSDHYLVGTVETFEDLGNDFDASIHQRCFV
jgi:hypothetical protein